MFYLIYPYLTKPYYALLQPYYYIFSLKCEVKASFGFGPHNASQYRVPMYALKTEITIITFSHAKKTATSFCPTVYRSALCPLIIKTLLDIKNSLIH